MDNETIDQAFAKLNQFRLEQKLCDATLIVDGRRYHVHKVVLAARSSFFYSLFRDGKTETVELLQSCFKDDRVMDTLLRYMYTGRVENVENIELIQKLVAVSDLLNLEGLQTHLAHILFNVMNVKNCPEVMKWSERYRLDTLLMSPLYESSEEFEPISGSPTLNPDTKYFLRNTNRFRSRGDFADVQLMVGESAFLAHKVILSAFNDYFTAMFTNETQEKTASIVEMKLVTSSAMESVLELFYTGKVSSPCYKEAQEMLMVADYLNIRSLKSTAVERLYKTICHDNVFYLLQLSIMHQCMALTSFVVSFLIKHFATFLESRELLGIPHEILHKVISSEELDVEEESIFEFIICWVKQDPQQRAKFLLNLLKQIRLEHVPLVYLESRILQTKLVHDSEDGSQYVTNIIRKKQTEHCCDWNCERPRGYTEAKIVVGVDEDQHICEYLCYLPASNRWFDIATNIDNTVLAGPIVSCSHGIFMLVLEPYKVHSYTVALLQLCISRYSLQWLKFDPLTSVFSGSFASYKDATSALESLNLTVLGDYLYTIGPCTYPSVLYCYNIVESDGWKLCASLNTQLVYCALTSCQGSVYMIGGMGTHYIPLSTVEKYVPGSHHCVTVPSMLEARLKPVCTSFKSTIFVVGGMVDEGEMGTSSEMYDCNTEEWSFFPGCGIPRRTAGVLCFKENIFLFGGLDEGYDSVDTNEVYNVSSNTWSIYSFIPAMESTQIFCCSTFLPKKTVQALPEETVFEE